MNERANTEREQVCSLLSPSSLDMVQKTGYRVTGKDVQAKVTAGKG